MASSGPADAGGGLRWLEEEDGADALSLCTAAAGPVDRDAADGAPPPDAAAAGGAGESMLRRHWDIAMFAALLVAALAVGIGISIVLQQISQNLVNDNIEIQFEYDALAYCSELNGQWAQIYLLETGCTQVPLLFAPELLSRENFTNYVMPVYDTMNMDGFTQIQAWSWIPRVFLSERPYYEAKAAADLNQSDYTFLQINPDHNGPHLVPAEDRPYYFPVYYIEPFASNKAASGFDLHSDPARAKALRMGASTRMPVTTEAITLVQETGTQQAVLSFFPAFSPVAPINSSEFDPNDALTLPELLGFVSFVVRMGDFVKAASQRYRDKHMVLFLNDTSSQPERVLYADQSDELAHGYSYDCYMEANNRLWRGRIVAQKAYVRQNGSRQEIVVLAMGLVMTFVMVFLLALIFAQFKKARLVSANLEVLLVEQQRLAEAAGAASKARSEFLANMSHELRTPLNGVIGTADLLSEVLPPSAREAAGAELAQLRSCADLLLLTVNDVMDFAMLEAAELKLHCAPTSLLAVAQAVLDTVRVRAKQKRLAVVAQVADSAQQRVVADEMRLGQVLVNFAANAVKFTPPEGQVQLRMALLRGDDAAEYSHLGPPHPPAEPDEAEPDDLAGAEVAVLEATVVDTGIGIPRERAGLLFHQFQQGDSSNTRDHGGAGLGLAMCHRLVQLMRGEIAVRSRVGRGSAFTVRLPVFLAGASPASLQERTLSLSYTDLGSRASGGSRGDDAGAEEDVVVVVQEGDEALQCGREGQSQSSGSSEELLEEVGSPPSASSSSSKKQKRKLRHDLTGVRVLVAEDNPVNQKIIMRMLKILGCDATCAENGQQAVEMCRQQEFDFVFMDCYMPVMDGYAATRAIRQLEGTRNCAIPIVALTANVESSHEEEAREAGMNSFLCKPVRIDQVGDCIASLAKPARPPT